MRTFPTAVITSALLIGTGLSAWAADAPFRRTAIFPVYENLPDGKEKKTETVAEILTSAKDGTMVVYTDSAMERLGFVDINDPASPKALGGVDLGGEPTSVAVIGNKAYVGVNTSESFTNPSGYLGVIDLDSKTITEKCDVKGQPDSVAVSPDGKFVAIAIENERDEDLNDGVIPQMPAGHLASFNIDGNGNPVNCSAVTITDLTGLAKIAPGDPEPEFVSISRDNLAVVTLQENNHIALVDLEKNEVVRHFSAGQTTIRGVDTTKDKSIHLDSTAENLLREPDAVAWIDRWRFVTANEGDYEGGSRGFTVFSKWGTVLYDSGNLTEALATAHGLYPEKRSHKKGTEPEGVAVGQYESGRMVFVGMERANAIAVFHDIDSRMDFVQLLPSGVAPEGILPIPSRNLLVVANEKDSAEDHIRSNISIYQIGADTPAFPHIHSVIGNNGQPIGWGALSGLTANPTDPTILYAVNDSFYSTADIFTVDVSAMPARITGVRRLMKNDKPAEKLDLEGIAQDKDGSFWIVSEGHPKKELKNLLLHVEPSGNIVKTIELPDVYTVKMERFGFEGVAIDGDWIVIAVQREWGDDPKGFTKLITYSKSTGEFGAVHYPLDKPESAAGGWTGLSEIVALGNKTFALIERDNQPGPDAAIKRIYTIDLNGVTPAKPGDALPKIEKKLAIDVLPVMQSYKGWTPDKLEGLTVSADGTIYAITDSDGVDDATGETLFFTLGHVDRLK